MRHVFYALGEFSSNNICMRHVFYTLGEFSSNNICLRYVFYALGELIRVIKKLLFFMMILLMDAQINQIVLFLGVLCHIVNAHNLIAVT